MEDWYDIIRRKNNIKKAIERGKKAGRCTEKLESYLLLLGNKAVVLENEEQR